jgi:ribonuclease HI
MAFYAVAKGRTPGIYGSWNEAKKQIDRFHGARYKRFDTQREANNFMSQREAPQKTKTMPLPAFFATEDPKEDDNVLIAFTDGSCLAQASHDRTGFAVCWPYHRELDFSQHVAKGTNNRAEYAAFIHAVQQADVLDEGRVKTLIVYTDSMLLINSVTKWLSSWKKNDWKKSDGHVVRNLDLVQTIDRLMQQRKVSFRHVKAHTGDGNWEARYNDIVDRMARSAAARSPQHLRIP